MSDLRDQRRVYQGDHLPDQLDGPWELFAQWFADAREEQAAGRLEEPNAMILATAAVASDGTITPSARAVLLKEYDEQGLVFYTHYTSDKGRELDATPRASLLFWWPSLARQIRFTGGVTKVTRQQSEEYFAMRPRGSQLGAWASHQSSPRRSYDELRADIARITDDYEGRDVPCPPTWGGYSLSPERVEFWQGQPSRVHDRVVCTLVEGAWTSNRLDP